MGTRGGLDRSVEQFARSYAVQDTLDVGSKSPLSNLTAKKACVGVVEHSCPG